MVVNLIMDDITGLYLDYVTLAKTIVEFFINFTSICSHFLLPIENSFDLVALSLYFESINFIFIGSKNY